MIHVNEIKLEGNTEWVNQFNLCSELFSKTRDESLSNEERKDALEEWAYQRQLLEMGFFSQ